MYTSVALKNFKAFADAKASNLRLVNLIVGDNGSGKTALLEGIFFASGVSPELVLRSRGWRGWGEGGSSLSMTREDLDRALWSDLFYRFEANNPAIVKMNGGGEEERSVTISYRRPGSKVVIPPDRRQRQKAPRVVPDPERIRFQWEIRGRPPLVVSAQTTKDGMVFSPESDAVVKIAFYSSVRIVSQQETAGRFTRLDQNFEVPDFERVVNEVYPHISDLSINMNLGTPLISARVGNLPEKIPLAAVSGGVNKLVNILLGIVDYPNGHILIDEIDNGFYYEKIPTIVNAIYKYAKKHNCQLFMSTHSKDCLQACAAIAKDNPDDFCLLQTEIGEVASVIRQFDGVDFASAVSHGVEVR